MVLESEKSEVKEEFHHTDNGPLTLVLKSWNRNLNMTYG